MLGTGRKLLRHERGTVAVEYGLVAALIVLVMLVGLSELADETQSIWSSLQADVEANT